MKPVVIQVWTHNYCPLNGFPKRLGYFLNFPDCFLVWLAIEQV
ncbi:hypothetical protein Xszus_01220 [Xenorhabdus szentirmaii]|nr:hypothetical protein Xsze_02910 [Xenorhabdus szentirmaii DSM 16338]PHM41528.1 hypothetical protein Xszus_01220 [Xenorhabdus szentirmaii]